MIDASKDTFLRVWPGGYKENWNVYGHKSGKSESEVVSRCLKPFYNKKHHCLEVGCGRGFWTNKYLCQNFKSVTAIDLLKKVAFRRRNVKYIEVPDRDFSCFGVDDNSVDFCWSFGVFCHLTIPACELYVESIFRKLKSGGRVALYFSNCERRGGLGTQEFGEDIVPFVYNNYAMTEKMLSNAGFVGVSDLMPDLFDTMITGTKP